MVQREMVINNVDSIRKTSKRFLSDITDIINENKPMLNNLETDVDALKSILNIFLCEKICNYELTDNNRVGIIWAFKQYYEFSLESDYADAIIDEINLYFNSFKFRVYNDSKDEEIKTILNDSDYKNKLYKILLDMNLDNTQRDIAIKELLEDYRIKNNIPDFSDVHLNQQWCGTRREADFIRAVKLLPKPAGKNSRKAQIKSILRSCRFEDDKEAQTLTLLEIYSERLPKVRKERTKKYEPYITVKLLQRLLMKDSNTLKTTTNKFFIDIGILPKTYQSIHPKYYQEIYEEYNKDTKKSRNYKNIKKNLEDLHEITREKLKGILDSVLESLQKKALITCQSYTVIVKGNQLIPLIPPIFDSEEKKLDKMVKRAEKYAANHVTAEVLNPETSQYEVRPLRDVKEVMKYYKYKTYMDIYDTYIQEEYGWSYTYQELKIVLTKDMPYIQDTIELETQKIKVDTASLFPDAIRKAIGSRFINTEKRYNEGYQDLKEKYMSSPDITAIFDEESIDKEVEKNYRHFKYNENFMDDSEIFIQHEIELGNKCQNKFKRWLSVHPEYSKSNTDNWDWET